MAIKSADQITIVDVTDAYSVILTSETYTFVGGSGGVAAGQSCTTEAVAFCGSNQCSSVNVTAADYSYNSSCMRSDNSSSGRRYYSK